MAVEGAMLIARFAELTRATDSDIASLLGLGRSTVQAYRTDRIPEKLSDAQVELLVTKANEYLAHVSKTIAEMEMLT